MAVLSDYTSGTITLANGSTAVTGTGTLFDVAKFREGDTLQIQNLTAVIASVNSNTSLTLTAPWTGTSLTNAPYRARYLPDGARVTAQTTTMIELLGNGNLQSIAGLAGAADQGIMFTGAGTVGGFFLPEIARSLLNMGGSAGIGKFPYFNSNSSANVADIVGAIASGSLMEVGYNSGWYWRFKNGLQITCAIGGTATINSPAGNIFVNGAAVGPYVHPAAFVEEPFCIVYSHKIGGTPGHSWAASVSRPTTTQTPQVQLFRATASGDIYFPVIVNIGRFQ